MQYELQGREGMRAIEMNRTPNSRAGMAPIATSARVAAAIANLPPVPPDAAAVMTGGAIPAAVPAVVPAEVPAAVPGGGAGVSGQGGSTGSGAAVAGAQEVVTTPARARSRSTSANATDTASAHIDFSSCLKAGMPSMQHKVTVEGWQGLPPAL